MENKTVITAVDEKYEWLLEWWFDNVRHNNPDLPITIADWGMSVNMVEWAMDNADTYIPLNRHEKHPWFHTVQLVIDSKYEYSAWIDGDCEVVGDISKMFDYADDEKIALTWDVCHEPEWFAAGVIVAKNDGNDLLRAWSDLCIAGTERGPQEALAALLKNEPDYEIGYIKLMPLDYQWLRKSLEREHDSPTKKIIHWTGPLGKDIIRKKIAIREGERDGPVAYLKGNLTDLVEQ